MMFFLFRFLEFKFDAKFFHNTKIERSPSTLLELVWLVPGGPLAQRFEDNPLCK